MYSILYWLFGDGSDKAGLKVASSLFEGSLLKAAISVDNIHPSKIAVVDGLSVVGADAMWESYIHKIDEMKSQAEKDFYEVQDSISNKMSLLEIKKDSYEAIKTYGIGCDLIVMSSKDVMKNDFLMYFHAAIYETARPVLIIPKDYKKDKLVANNIAINWNSSKRTARSIFAALPFLIKSKEVNMYYNEAIMNDNTLEEIDVLKDFLYIKGVKNLNIIKYSEGRKRDKAELFYNLVKEKNTDMIVQGAFCQGTFRHLLLGSNTDFLIKNSEIPVFFRR